MYNYRSMMKFYIQKDTDKEMKNTLKHEIQVKQYKFHQDTTPLDQCALKCWKT